MKDINAHPGKNQLSVVNEKPVVKMVLSCPYTMSNVFLASGISPHFSPAICCNAEYARVYCVALGRPRGK